MALLERVSTLIRANLNDMIDRAEDPEKMIKQVILDMRNQLMQVKTQVAIAIADQHLLEKKQIENHASEAEWMRKAELAVDKKQDDLARAAIERAMSYKSLAQNFADQVADQKIQVEELKTALHKLEQKLVEAQAKSDLLLARHRRSRALDKAADARSGFAENATSETFERMNGKVDRTEAVSQAKAELLGADIEDKLAALEKEDTIDKMLAEMKQKKSLTA
ncbi:MAG TPA: PspA/IM30 family protein [Terriglobales bacterium]|jgi:phage shock protein A|nr:PspA/IM30 family protein [Terriglobales bacterium]